MDNTIWQSHHYRKTRPAKLLGKNPTPRVRHVTDRNNSYQIKKEYPSNQEKSDYELLRSGPSIRAEAVQSEPQERADVCQKCPGLVGPERVRLPSYFPVNPENISRRCPIITDMVRILD